MDEITKTLASLAVGSAALLGLCWRIYKWIDKKTREQIAALEIRLAACELATETARQQRITEVDAERALRLLAQEDAARLRAAVITAQEDAARLRSAALLAVEVADELRLASLGVAAELRALRASSSA